GHLRLVHAVHGRLPFNRGREFCQLVSRHVCSSPSREFARPIFIVTAASARDHQRSQSRGESGKGPGRSGYRCSGLPPYHSLHWGEVTGDIECIRREPCKYRSEGGKAEMIRRTFLKITGT